MSYYVSGVDPAYIYKRQGTTQDPYISRNETAQIVSGIVTLAEIPDSVNKVNINKTDGTILTEVTTSTLSTNQYRVDYTSGVVYFNSSLEGSMVISTYKGTGYVSFPSSRIWVDTSGQNSNKTLQQMFTDIDNLKTHWLTAVNTFSDIAITYPSPSLGDTVQTTSDSKIYRFDGTTWVNTQQYSSNALMNVQNKIGDITSLQTTAKSDLVSAVNEHQSKVAQIGNISTLSTVAKDTLVNAVNEDHSKFGDLSTLKTTSKTTLVSAINEHEDQIGDLNTLQTSAKNNLVSAVNENYTNIGSLSSLQTTAKSNVINAINEIKSQANTNDANTNSNATAISGITTNIGSLSNLTTTNKSSLVNAVNEHIGKTNNPHAVTASQVGAYSKTESDGKYAIVANLTWINVSFLNTFSDWGTGAVGNYPLTSYAKDNMNNVRLRGMVRTNTYGNQNAMFNIPSPYRPNATRNIICAAFHGSYGWGLADVEVNSNGNVSTQGTLWNGNTGAPPLWVDISSISYPIS